MIALVCLWWCITALNCALSQSEESEVTIACLELVARDVYDLFRLFQEKLIIVSENHAILEGLDEAEASSVLASLQTSYKSFYPRVQDFLDQTADLLAMYGFKIKTKLEPEHDFDAAPEEKPRGGDDEAAEDRPVSSSSLSSPSTSTSSTIDVEVSPSGASLGSSSSAGKKKIAGKLKGESGIEEGVADEQLTPYDDSTPWEKSGGGRVPPPRRKQPPPRVVEEDDQEDEWGE